MRHGFTCDDSCHFILLYNKPSDFDCIEEDEDYKDELMGYVNNADCSSDEKLKQYLRNAFYFILCRQTKHNLCSAGRSRNAENEPALELFKFVMSLGILPTFPIVKLFEAIRKSDSPKNRAFTYMCSCGDAEDYESYNWEREGMDAEADKWCNLFVDVVFRIIRRLWRKSCIIDYPFDSDWNSQNCGDFIDYMAFKVMEKRERIASYEFRDSDAGKLRSSLEAMFDMMADYYSKK